jgi:hypothetical protein
MSDQHARQSFLGANSEATLAAAKIGVVGLGGGGSHIVQQLAHIGVGQFVLFDPDHIDVSNLNRLVGGTLADVRERKLKTVIAQRVIEEVNAKARVTAVSEDWRNRAELLRDCDILVGCVDSYASRGELEVAARRYVIPYLDIGMDVHRVGDEYVLAGQVILSMPGQPCLRCVGFLNDAVLKAEAERYGQAGDRPQVVWPNGVLASVAVGIVVGLLTPWHTRSTETLYLEYDGNGISVERSNRMRNAPSVCRHFGSIEGLGDPWFRLGAE